VEEGFKGPERFVRNIVARIDGVADTGRSTGTETVCEIATEITTRGKGGRN